MWDEHKDVAGVFHEYNLDIMGYLNVADIPYISM
jgi:hypothetical protein